MKKNDESCFQIAVRILARSNLATSHLEQKLLSKNFSLIEINTALEKLLTLGYLKDQEGWKTRAQHLIEKYYAPEFILADIKKRGFNVTLEEVLLLFNEMNCTPEKQIQMLIEKSLKTSHSGGARIVRKILSKGHELEKILPYIQKKLPDFIIDT